MNIKNKTIQQEIQNLVNSLKTKGCRSFFDISLFEREFLVLTQAPEKHQKIVVERKKLEKELQSFVHQIRSIDCADRGVDIPYPWTLELRRNTKIFFPKFFKQISVFSPWSWEVLEKKTHKNKAFYLNLFARWKRAV